MSPSKKSPGEAQAPMLDASPFAWLEGGGEMGSRMRAFDWSKTAIGAVQGWPQSLRSPLSMMLPSKAQIALFWGPEFIVFYNDAYLPVLGAKHPGALGLPGREAWNEIWDSTLHALLEGVVRTGEAFWAKDMLFTIERYGFLEDTYFDVSYDPVRDESGRIAGVYCIVTETTDRVVWERRLALLKDLAARTAAARTPREACMLTMETFATRPGDVPFALAYLDDEWSESTPGAQISLADAKPEHVREIPIPRSGNLRPGRLIIGLNPKRPIDAHYESFLELLASQFSTAVASAQAHEDERKRAEALAELDRAKTAFFSNVSHEFRTPLTLMLGPIEELLAQEDGANRDLLTVIQRNGQRLLKLVNTLLDFARIEAGRAQASYELTDLAALTTDLASNFRAACEKAALEFVVDCPKAPAYGWVDREMWEKIVLNLLSNAFKFTLEGGITVRLVERDGYLQLTVRDTGIGITHTSLARIFERFQRIEGAHGRSHEGSGIGLALVQELVKLHGGQIRVDSSPGQGTLFIVEIPSGSDHLPAEHVVTRTSQTRATTRAGIYVAEALGWLPGMGFAESAPQRKSAGRILVADDNADLRDYAWRLLSEHYEVETAEDGQGALEAARARRPDLIVSDVMMPNLDGFGLVRKLREDPALNTIPIIMLSARAGEEARLEGLSRGADDYLVKPFSGRELLGRVAALLQLDDIRRNALEALRQSTAHVKALLDHAPIGAYLVDADFRILEINPVAQPVFGEIPGGVIGRNFHEIMHILWEKNYADEITGVFQRTLKTGESYIAAEHVNKRLDRGVTEYYEWRVDRIPLSDGRNGVVCYFRDISAQVNARKALEQSREALRAADRRKDEFLATLAHELRNPLAPLRNGLEVLKMAGNNRAAAEEARTMMKRQLEQMVRLIDDLLDVNRISRDMLELHKQRFTLQKAIDQALETSRPLIESRRHTLTVNVPAQKIVVEADLIRLTQIFANVLNNAAKYTEPGGHIALTAESHENEVVVKIRDDGLGIPPDKISRVFELFMQVDHSLERSQGGLGIGLSLVKRLVEMHGGSVEAHSAGVSKGSEFVIRLPIVLSSLNSMSETTQVVADRREPGGCRILVADDSRDAADSLALMLQMLGHTCQTAPDGLTALELGRSFLPDLILLDIGMPSLNGYETARRIRAEAWGKAATLVAISGWGQSEDRRRSEQAGFDLHLVKPIAPSVIQEIIDRLQQHRKNSRTLHDQATT